MPSLENPVEKLSKVVNQLYGLAGNLSEDNPTEKKQRIDLLHKAYDLRGDLNVLVTAQFTQRTAAYNKSMADIDSVTTALNQAENDISHAIEVINGAGQLAKSLDDLIKEAIKIGGLFA